MAISIKYEEDINNSNKHIVWREKMTFDLKLPIDKQSRPHIYLSKDFTKMLVLPNDCFDPLIYQSDEK